MSRQVDEEETDDMDNLRSTESVHKRMEALLD